MNQFKQLFEAKKHIFMPFFMLGYPNIEVKEAFIHNLLEVYTHQTPTIVSQAMIKIEDALQDMHNKFHRRKIIIQKQNPIKVRLFNFRLRFGNYDSSRVITKVII